MQFVEDCVGRCANRGLVHQVPAGPESPAEKKGLLDQERLETRRGQVVRTEQSRRAAADDDDVAFDEPIEFLEIFPRDLPRDVSLPQGSRPFVCHNCLYVSGGLPTDRFPTLPS